MKRHVFFIVALLISALVSATDEIQIQYARSHGANIGGYVTAVAVQGCDTQFTVTAVAETGWKFLRWADDASITSTTRVIIKSPDANDAFTAVFVSDHLNSDYGKVVPTQTDNKGYTFQLTAQTAGSCAQFSQWTDGEKSDSPRTYSVGSDCKLSAQFSGYKMDYETTDAKQESTTTATITANSIGCKNTFTVNPTSGYVLYRWVKVVKDGKTETLVPLENDTARTQVLDYDSAEYRAQIIPANVIQFNLNGHAASPASIDNAIGVARTAPSVTPATGYSFIGWSESQSATTAEVTFPYFCQRTLYAVYSAIPYTVSFDMQSKGAAVSPMEGSVETPVVLPSAEAYDGYIFTGWKVNNEGDLLTAGSNYYPSAATTMYAQYKDATAAQIGETTYNSIAEAITAASSSDVITIMKNVTEDITIADTKSIKIDGNGKTLTGTVTIKMGGKLTITGPKDLSCSALYLEGTSGKSSQLIGENYLKTEVAYYDCQLEANNTMASPDLWYAVAVPFEVKISDGIARQSGTGTHINEVDYLVLTYDGQKRADNQNGKGWVDMEEDSVMQPGRFYMIGIDGTENTWRFTKKAGSALAGQSTQVINAYASAKAGDAGWNALSNSTLIYADVSTNQGVVIAQVYENGAVSPNYKVKHFGESSFVMASPFFVQATAGADQLNLIEATNDVLYAPTRATVKPYYKLQLGRSSNGEFIEDDVVFLTASEDASNEYEMGKDVAKLQGGDANSYLWTSAYGYKLCAQHAPVVNDIAEYSLGMSAPKAASYVLKMNYADDATLWLNNTLVWNFNMGSYELDLQKGTNAGYTLRLGIPKQLPTTLNAISTDNKVQKFLHNGVLYIQLENRIFNAQGSIVR